MDHSDLGSYNHKEISSNNYNISWDNSLDNNSIYTSYKSTCSPHITKQTHHLSPFDNNFNTSKTSCGNRYYNNTDNINDLEYDNSFNKIQIPHNPSSLYDDIEPTVTVENKNEETYIDYPTRSFCDNPKISFSNYIKFSQKISGKNLSTMPKRQKKGLSNSSSKHSNINSIQTKHISGNLVFDLSVEKRNARERNRVKQINDAFNHLKLKVPMEKDKRKVSKVETLRHASDYIVLLSKLLRRQNDPFQNNFIQQYL
ncbi:unnamed protein product [Gordionus sp. m RMFG-2023]